MHSLYNTEYNTECFLLCNNTLLDFKYYPPCHSCQLVEGPHLHPNELTKLTMFSQPFPSPSRSKLFLIGNGKT